MQIIIVSIVAIASCAPQNLIFTDNGVVQNRPIAILRDDREGGTGGFKYTYETENGIYEEKEGYLGVDGSINMRGVVR